MVGHHKHTAEFVKQRLKLGAPHVLIVHNLFQVVMSSEIVQQPEEDEMGFYYQCKSTVRQEASRLKH